MPTAADPATTDPPKWSWRKVAAVCLLLSMFPFLGYIFHWHDVAAVVSLLTILLTFLSPGLGDLLRQIFGRRVHRRIQWLAAIVDPDMSVTIREFEGPVKMKWRCEAYEEVKAYLGASCSLKARHLMAETAKNSADDDIELTMRNGEEVTDEIEGSGITVWWSAFTMESKDRGAEGRYRLYYQECHREYVLHTYLQHARRRGRDLIRERRQPKIVTNTSGHGWTYNMLFKHPKTFDTLAMDDSKKQEIIADLNKFKTGREDYARLGKPWKRGYLLYGPPGTGKSSMVAAMANYLNYDVYDIELMSVSSNSELRQLLISTKSKSVIVIEDIDCSLDLTGARRDGDRNDNDGDDDDDGAPSSNKVISGRSLQVTLSGLLNFIDGLWSACGEERIIVFTTNHIGKLDPALIRRGRMDMHIEMSYCRSEAFRLLANMYLKVDSHPMFGAIEKLLEEVNMTPADVAENLMTGQSNGDSAVDSCLQHLVDQLQRRRTKKGKAKGARIADAARAVPQGATDEGPRRSPRFKELSMPQGAPDVLD